MKTDEEWQKLVNDTIVDILKIEEAQNRKIDDMSSKLNKIARDNIFYFAVLISITILGVLFIVSM
jgi:hypothetical protein